MDSEAEGIRVKDEAASMESRSIRTSCGCSARKGEVEAAASAVVEHTHGDEVRGAGRDFHREGLFRAESAAVVRRQRADSTDTPTVEVDFAGVVELFEGELGFGGPVGGNLGPATIPGEAVELREPALRVVVPGAGHLQRLPSAGVVHEKAAEEVGAGDAELKCC